MNPFCVSILLNGHPKPRSTWPDLSAASAAAEDLSRRVAEAVEVRSVNREWEVVAEYVGGKRVRFSAEIQA